MRISDWSSDVCSSDLEHRRVFKRNLQPVRNIGPLAHRPLLGAAKRAATPATTAAAEQIGKYIPEVAAIGAEFEPDAFIPAAAAKTSPCAAPGVVAKGRARIAMLVDFAAIILGALVGIA